MILYVRHLAWLHAVPEKKKESRFKSIKAANEDSFLLVMPDVGDAEYLIPLLCEAGLVSQSGMGVAPLSWAEIQSWLNCTNLKLTTWEVTTIRQLSEAYATEYSAASDPLRPAPYIHVVEDIQEVDHEAVAKKLKAAFRELRKK